MIFAVFERHSDKLYFRYLAKLLNGGIHIFQFLTRYTVLVKTSIKFTTNNNNNNKAIKLTNVVSKVTSQALKVQTKHDFASVLALLP